MDARNVRQRVMVHAPYWDVRIDPDPDVNAMRRLTNRWAYGWAVSTIFEAESLERISGGPNRAPEIAEDMLLTIFDHDMIDLEHAMAEYYQPRTFARQRTLWSQIELLTKKLNFWFEILTYRRNDLPIYVRRLRDFLNRPGAEHGHLPLPM